MENIGNEKGSQLYGEKIISYPKEIEEMKDNFIARAIWDILRYGDLTKTLLKNKLYDLLFKEMSKGKEFEEVLSDLIKKGLIKSKKKQTEINILTSS